MGEMWRPPPASDDRKACPKRVQSRAKRPRYGYRLSCPLRYRPRHVEACSGPGALVPHARRRHGDPPRGRLRDGLLPLPGTRSRPGLHRNATACAGTVLSPLAGGGYRKRRALYPRARRGKRSLAGPSGARRRDDRRFAQRARQRRRRAVAAGTGHLTAQRQPCGAGKAMRTQPRAARGKRVGGQAISKPAPGG